MPFVNENISIQDREDFGLDEINKKYRFIDQDWTVDHERKIFLTKYWEGHDMGSDTDLSVWLFYWRGEICQFTKKIIEYKKVAEKHYSSTQKILDIQIPEKYHNDKENFLIDMVDAIQVCQEIGIFSKMTQYDLTVDLSEVQ